VKLPAGKILLPGVVSYSTDLVEHPELMPIPSSHWLSSSADKTSPPAPTAAWAPTSIRKSSGQAARPARRRSDREQEVVELNFKSACAGGTKQKQGSLEVKVSPLLSFLFGSLRMFT